MKLRFQHTASYVKTGGVATRRRSAPRPREVTKEETRKALIAAGLAEFAANGLDAPSLDAICARAGFTRGAFYVHFRDREDFQVAVMEQVIGSFLDAVIATDDEAHDLEHTIDRFAATTAAALAGPAAPPDTTVLPPFALGVAFHRLLEACTRSPDLRARFVHLVREGAGRVATATRRGQVVGTVRRDVDPEQLALVLVTLALGIVTVLETGVPFDVARARATVQQLVSCFQPSPAGDT